MAADGTTSPGVIVEHVSLGLAMCAERVAPVSTVAHGGRPTALAPVAPRTQKDMTWPCGACLQAARALGGPGMAVYVSGTDDDSPIEESTVGELLPRGPYIDR